MGRCYVEVDPTEYDIVTVDDDGCTWIETGLPVDEFRCSTCDGPIGYVYGDEDDGPTSVRWTACFVLDGDSMLREDPAALCEDCVPENLHESVDK